MIAVVGLGRWGERHLATICQLLDPTEVIGVDLSPAARTAAEARGVATVATIDELPEGVRGAIVATPTHTHVEVASRLLDRGVHLLVEKPIALRPEDALSLVETAKDRGLVLMVGHVLLFHKAHERLREEVRRLGPLKMLILERRTPGRLMEGSGAWVELAPHELAAAIDLGALSTPATVDGFLPWSVTGCGTEDGAFARFRSNGCAVEIRCSWIGGVRRREVWAIAESGQVVMTDDGGVSRIAVVPGRPLWTDTRPPAPEWETVPGPPPLQLEQSVFLDAIRGGDSAIRSDGAMALQVTELLHQVAQWNG